MKKRSTFRKEFTGEEWGQSKYYNLSIDTTHLSYQQAADLILYYKKSCRRGSEIKESAFRICLYESFFL